MKNISGSTCTFEDLTQRTFKTEYIRQLIRPVTGMGAVCRRCRLPLLLLACFALFCSSALSAEPKSYSVDSGKTCSFGNNDSFRIDTDSKGLNIKVFYEPVQGSDEIEVFLMAPGNTPDPTVPFTLDPAQRAYLQFYCRPAEKTPLSDELKKIMREKGLPEGYSREVELYYYYYGPYIPELPVIRKYSGTVTENGGRGELTISIPWSELIFLFPLKKETADSGWKFDICRTCSGKTTSWNGKLHQPDTWGRIFFQAADQQKLADIYKNIIQEEGCGRFLDAIDKKTLPEAFEKFGKCKESIREKARAASVNVSELEKLAFQSAKAEIFSECVTSLQLYAKKQDSWETYLLVNGEKKPYSRFLPGHGAELVLEYCFKDDFQDKELYLCDVGTTPCKGDLEAVILLDGIQKGKIDDLKKPFNFKLGNVSANSKLTVRIREKNKETVSFDLRLRVTAFAYSTAPRAALNLLDPSPDAPSLPLAPDGNPWLPSLAVYYGEVTQMITQKPDVVIFGGGYACGFKSSKSYRELSERLNIYDAGIVDSNLSVIQWKIENSVIDLFPPKTVVIEPGGMIGSPEKSAEFVHNMIRSVKRKSPRSKIILTGIPPGKPRSAVYHVSREKEYSFAVNRLLKEIARKEGVLFCNCEEEFLDKDENLRLDLYNYSGVFLSEEGYRIWSREFSKELLGGSH